jgi:hypothetical protein
VSAKSLGLLRASLEAGRERRGSWAHATRGFEPPIDLSARPALGLWVHGDGRGEVVNLQLACPEHIVAGLGEHYIEVDFQGWRYFELIEPEGERYSRFAWPYGNPYSIYRENVDYAHVARLALWVNRLPPGEAAECILGPVRALPLVKGVIRDPSIAISGRSFVFPVEIETGQVLEWSSTGSGEAELRGPDGSLLGKVRPQGDAPRLVPGGNRVEFGFVGAHGSAAIAPDSAPALGLRPRARVTLSCTGEALAEE